MERQEHDESFKYDVLPDPRTHFRLLEIVRGGLQDHVVCKLTVWPLKAAPPYLAISYTWGDATSLSIITINGCRLSVRSSCEYVLQQQAGIQNSLCNYYWVDAICINQEDVEEKSYQVGLMGTIYSNAVRVNACVGPHADDSDYLFNTIREKRFTLQWIHRHLIYPDADSKYPEFDGWSNGLPLLKSRFIELWCLLTTNATTRQRLAKAFLAFMKRSYFSRVWILQEVALGRGVSFCCGESCLSLSLILAFNVLVEFWIYRMERIYPHLEISYLHDWIESKNLSRRIKSCASMREDFGPVTLSQSCLVLADRAGFQSQTLDVLAAMKYFQCHDVRDKIYGVLAIIDWPTSATPFPDYKRNAFELACEILATVHLQRASMKDPRSMVAAAALLRDLLQVSLDQTAVQRAINLRLPSVEASQEKDEIRYYHHQQEPKSDKRLADVDWFGIQLLSACSDPSDPRCIDILYRSEMLQQQRIVKLCDRHGSLLAYAPSETQESDWFVEYPWIIPGYQNSIGVWEQVKSAFKQQSGDEPSSAYKPHIAGIIIREGSDGICDIIGQTYPIQNWKDDSLINMYESDARLKRFHIYWHAEDLMLMEMRYSQSLPCEERLQEILEWLKVRTCVGRNYSLVKGPFDDHKFGTRIHLISS